MPQMFALIGTLETTIELRESACAAELLDKQRSCKRTRNKRLTIRQSRYRMRAMTNSAEARAKEVGLRAIRDVRSFYILPDDPFVESVLIPCFSVADNVDCMMGFFSSESLVSLAPGLATFIDNSSAGGIRLIISPFLKPADQSAIKAGVSPTEASVIAIAALRESLDTKDFIERHALKCLTWLIHKGRVQIKVALMKDAMFHLKTWLFHHRGDAVAAHGSSNMTDAGIRRNIEQVAASRSWDGADSSYAVQRLDAQFNALWSNADDNCVVTPMPEAIKADLLRDYSSETPPKESDLRELNAKAKDTPKPPAVADTPKFEIPAELRYEDGPFAHQGAAANSWLGNGCRGVLEMATGSGKTIASMICAKKLSERDGRPLLIVVAVPYRPLIQQWCDEIAPFGLAPVNLSLESGNSRRASALGRVQRALRRADAKAHAIVVTHDLLCDERFQARVSEFDCAALLIADEVHNLGRPQFINSPPEFFDYRLGLSATPERQYDEEGTAKLFDFFGGSVFSFGLEEAIGECLVPYDYFIHPVELTPDEMERWEDISERIRAHLWELEDNSPPSDYLAKLLRDRRAVLENAANKVSELQRLLSSETSDSLRHTLIYASDKNPTQLEEVNRLLNQKGVLFHQLTYEETADRRRATDILREFQEGTLRVLTAKRVLDEGVNIPQVRKAYILASTTVERQWTQRRGRLLRKCDEIGKTHSEIHDFVALPPMEDGQDSDYRAIFRGELHRAREFASLARNAGSADGPLNALADLIRGAAL